MGLTVAHLRLRFVKAYVDRHGTVRRYFRRKGFKDVPLPGMPGSREFMDAYQAALDTTASAAPKLVGLDRSKPGTMSALIAEYYASPECPSGNILSVWNWL